MAESIVCFLFDKLSLLLQHEQRLLGGLEQEVEYIRDELGHMRALLRVADAKEENDPQLKEWIKRVREISYDVEDILKEYMLCSTHRSPNGFSGRIKRICASIKNLRGRYRIASQFQRIKYRVENASKSRQRYRDMYVMTCQGSTLANSSWYDTRGDAPLLGEADVVGIENSKRQLMTWLWSTDYGLKVISVVGMGGLGKTTLVKKVYDDVSEKLHFDHYVWITISESFKVESLLENMIKQLVGGVKQSPPQGLEAISAEDI